MGRKGGSKDTVTQGIARFALQSKFKDFQPDILERLKLHLLDSLGCALGAFEGEPIRELRDQIEEFGGKPICTLIGGGKTAPDRAADVPGVSLRRAAGHDFSLDLAAAE